MTRFVPLGASPETQARESPRRCCAKCRRGTAALGEFPCGLALSCACHDDMKVGAVEREMITPACRKVACTAQAHRDGLCRVHYSQAVAEQYA